VTSAIGTFLSQMWLEASDQAKRTLTGMARGIL
jgi:hypothetical protein